MIFDVNKIKTKKLLVVTAVDTVSKAEQLLEVLVQSGHCRHQTLIGSHVGATDLQRFSADSAFRKLTEYKNLVLWAPFNHEIHSNNHDQTLREKYTFSLIEHLAEHSVSTLSLMQEHVEKGRIMVLALLADEVEKATEHARLMLRYGSYAFHSTEILPMRKR